MKNTLDFKDYYVNIEKSNAVVYNFPVIIKDHKSNTASGEVYCLTDILKYIAKAERELLSLKTIVRARIATVHQFSMNL